MPVASRKVFGPYLLHCRRQQADRGGNSSFGGALEPARHAKVSILSHQSFVFVAHRDFQHALASANFEFVEIFAQAGSGWYALRLSQHYTSESTPLP